MAELDSIAPKATIETLRDDLLEKYILSLVEQPTGTYDPETIKRDLVGFKMPMHIASPRAPVVHFMSDFYERLNAIGCSQFPEDNPKKTISLLKGTYLYCYEAA